MNPGEYNNDAPSRRGIFLTAVAILLVVAAISDLTKVLQHAHADHLGLVILGHRFTRPLANIVLGPLFALFLACYAYGIWNMRAWVIPLALFYAFYVPVNEVLFWSLHYPGPPTRGFILFYLLVSLASSIGAALVLAFRQRELQ
ncbi:MAG TPA: hypothetical protein VMT64_15190 [Candidatus Binataceae bacterium]|nr:hypothetical protein [Candidatus Binataceae bacterium]